MLENLHQRTKPFISDECASIVRESRIEEAFCSQKTRSVDLESNALAGGTRKANLPKKLSARLAIRVPEVI